jgi:hypothetical protein
MKKEQFTLRMLPIVRISLEKQREKSNYQNTNDYINSILENHITKKQNEENIVEAFTKRLEETEEKLEKSQREIANLMAWNKAILGKILAKLNLEA